ncbi:SUPPRESSOR OF RPS4-RLD 1, SUPPRESSOR OF RPS4-RLD 3 [Hibiscus trionum]|uniref:SUPPRESSOR OF RPS4-RLD 1, SUPPRESSOR OF RPS4-RLD 3 n=1 Tax=Hibiscus trionum TaxID=183268 RepID=A0A9W7LUT6_HIBTR|nr:SUPPRESSOR OF RPS4-RLD 1, SUPPRESSOR OF RPS4-RLD 3 [Hibiscus trionum]
MSSGMTCVISWQLYRVIANSEKAFDCLQQVLQIDKMFDEANHIRGCLLLETGEHREAIKDFSNGLSIKNSNIEYLFFRASCYHAIGEYAAAVKDYDAARHIETDSMEKFKYQWLAYYQKEIALYTASKFNTEFSQFNIDGDFDTLFKENWCIVIPTDTESERLMVFRQPPLSLKGGKLKEKDMSNKKNKAALLLAADSIGKKIQYDCPGFLSNRRKYRMAGLAAIEIAQKVSKTWSSLHGRKKRISLVTRNRGGAGTSSSSQTSMMSWQELYSLAVRWRQISEPSVQVVWLSKLREEFNSGFSCLMPLVFEQNKSVCYFPNYEIGEVKKNVISSSGLVLLYYFAFDFCGTILTCHFQIEHTKTFDEPYELVGEDFFVTTWCNSTSVEGR